MIQFFIGIFGRFSFKNKYSSPFKVNKLPNKITSQIFKYWTSSHKDFGSTEKNLL